MAPVAETVDVNYGRNRGDTRVAPWQNQGIFSMAETGVALMAETGDVNYGRNWGGFENLKPS